LSYLVFYGLLIIFLTLALVNIRLQILSTLTLINITWRKGMIFLTLTSVNIEVDIFLLWRQWIIPSVNPSIIFNIWPDVRPFSSPPSFLLLPCKSFLCNKTVTPPSQSQYNSISHNLSSHHNTSFVNICILIEILLKIFHFKEANLPFLKKIWTQF